MFTGIIEATASVLVKQPHRLLLEKPGFFTDSKVGSSICVSGVCLTITELTDASMAFDLAPETLSKTTIGSWRQGDRANLERALRADGRFDGHVVQGHVEGVGEVRAVREAALGKEIDIELPVDLASFAVPRGSVAVDGVSLTIAAVQDGRIRLALIPQTLRETTLKALAAGSRVNVETDILVRAALRGGAWR